MTVHFRSSLRDFWGESEHPGVPAVNCWAIITSPSGAQRSPGTIAEDYQTVNGYTVTIIGIQNSHCRPVFRCVASIRGRWPSAPLFAATWGGYDK